MRPKCPNHVVQMDPTDNRRIWICPISGARFECDVESTDKEIKLDKFGQAVTQYKITPLDGIGG